MQKIVFGPITSRRFGQSLGIDLSPEKKQCNFDCVYCELKGSKPVKGIENPINVKEIISQVKEALVKYKDLDVITLTANGEPTLYPYLDKLICELDKIKGNTKTLILSNGATVVDKNISKILTNLDIVKLSLDCVSPKCFKKIDRPLKNIDIEKIVEAIKNFRKIHNEELIIEILVVKGINDKEEEFLKLNEVLKNVNPDRIDISTIDRPPAYDVKGVSIKRLKELASVLQDLPISIAYKKDYSEEKREFSKEEILNTLDKRPQSFDDVRVCFSKNSIDILNSLLEEKKVYIKSVAGVDFYKTR